MAPTPPGSPAPETDDGEAAPAPPPPVAPWVPATTLALSLVGLAVSAYLTFEHYSSSSTLACPDTGAINCTKVTDSSYSMLLGVPVALLGLLFFVAMVPLSLPVAWRAGTPWVARLRLLLLAVGVPFVLYLVWAELFRIDAICLWCTVVHLVTVVLFAVVALVAAADPAPDLGTVATSADP